MKVNKKISDKLKKEGRSQAWLASKIGCTRQHMSLVMLGKATLTPEKLKAINKALQTEYAQ